MARSILYWTYEVTSLDAHADVQRFRSPWHDTPDEAQAEADDYTAELELLGHVDIGVTITPTYAPTSTAGTVRTWA